MIQKSYRKFLESQNTTDIEAGIGLLNELNDVFIDLEDDWGFDIKSKVRLGKNYYDTGGNVIDTITGKAYLRGMVDWVSISGSKRDIELGELVTISTIILNKAENINNLVTGRVELDLNASYLEIFEKITRDSIAVPKVFYPYKYYSDGGLHWAFFSSGETGTQKVDLDQMVQKYKEAGCRVLSRANFSLAFKILN